MIMAHPIMTQHDRGGIIIDRKLTEPEGGQDVISVKARQRLKAQTKF